MIPTTIGNMIGGGFFVGRMYWYLYLTGEEDVEIEFNSGPIVNATAIGGPMNYGQTSNVMHGHDPRASVPSDRLPNSGSHMISGLSKELSADKCSKRKTSDVEKVNRSDAA